ncbi:xanthan lyase [Deltaproteobacteria bacterium]|nr:xanthan lyase [Deltaproteobacteria bacterium]
MFLISIALAAPPFPIDLPGETEGALTGAEVYLSQCHGWIWYDSLDGFSTQRGTWYETVEDFHNPEGANQALAPFLHNAGADVWAVKERDLHDAWSIADNDGDGYAESGAGIADGNAGFADWGTWAYGENPFDGGTTRLVPAGASATFSLTAPARGWTALYVAYDADQDHTAAASYAVTARGVTVKHELDQRTHGSTWRYLDTLWLDVGDPVSVTVSTTSGVVSTDAVRLGGGTGVIERHGETTVRPRWEEGAILAAQFNGAPASVYDPYDDGNGSDPSSRSVWAAWEHPEERDSVYVSWHSNACDGCDARGTSVYVYDSECSSGAPIAGSDELAGLIQEELIAVGEAWDPEWQDRGVRSDCFSEVNPSLNDEMPAVLIEIAFHDTEADIELLKEPGFRIDASRAIYRGIARYLEGEGVTFLPEPPQALTLRNTETGLSLTWEAGWAGDLWGDEPVDYLVQTSADGRAWSAGVAVTGLSTPIDAEFGELLFARVVARNGGGVSFPSAVVAAQRGEGVPILLVNAFDRLDSGQLEIEDLGGELGEVARMDLARINPGDILVSHALAIHAAGWPFDSAEDDALGSLDPYALVVWATGEESTIDATFDDDQQAALRAFVAEGGALWTSGAELLWDLDEKGDADDAAFAAEVLGATYAADSCDCGRATGATLLEGLMLEFGTVYPVEWADELDSAGTVLAHYPDGAIAGALTGNVAVFGFPFDAMGDASVQAEIAARLLPVLVPGWEPADTGDGVITPGGSLRPGKPVPLAEGCGCSAGGAGMAGWMVVLGVVVARRGGRRFCRVGAMPGATFPSSSGVRGASRRHGA